MPSHGGACVALTPLGGGDATAGLFASGAHHGESTGPSALCVDGLAPSASWDAPEGAGRAYAL